MAESIDKGLPLLAPAEFDLNDPNNPKYCYKNKEKLDELNKNLEVVNENYNKQYRKKYYKLSIIFGIIISTIPETYLINILINPASLMSSYIISGICFAIVNSLICAQIVIKQNIKMKVFEDKIADIKYEIKKIEEDETKSKELRLNKKLDDNFRKAYDEMLDFEYIDPFEKHISDFKKFVKENPEEAKKIVLDALVETGTIEDKVKEMCFKDSDNNSLDNGKSFVKKREK